MFDLISIIKVGGYLAVGGIVFAESGLLVGFFLPGDSLLFTAGFLASQGYLNIVALIIVTFVAAVVGDTVGYLFGKKVGPKIFTRDESIFFDKQHIARAQKFYDAHGGKAVTLARFMPVVRTFAPIVAGVGQMPYRSFVFYNVLGALLWAVGLPLVGFFAGSYIPNVDKYLMPIIAGILLLSVSPAIVHLIRHKHDRDQAIQKIKQLIKLLAK
jgi:membrane-associated protein